MTITYLIPQRFHYIKDIQKIEYNGINLNTSYLLDIMSESIMRYHTYGNRSYRLHSLILKEIYGKFYNYYMDFLIENNFIHIVSDYMVDLKARTYKLYPGIMNDTVPVDVFPNKFTEKKKRITFKHPEQHSPILSDVRGFLQSDITRISIDHVGAIEWIDKEKEEGNLTIEQHTKSKISIDKIKRNDIYCKFDKFGRMHTNFTTLKKHLRNEYVTIDGAKTSEIDIKNSQPFFLANLILSENKEISISDEFKKFKNRVINGTFYDEFLVSNPDVFKSRPDVKKFVYKVLFGMNREKCLLNDTFKQEYPLIHSFVVDFKKKNNNYKSLSYKLQRLESDFIYNDVIAVLKSFNIDVPMFTVHDSIVCKESDMGYVKEMFDTFMEEKVKILLS